MRIRLLQTLNTLNPFRFELRPHGCSSRYCRRCGRATGHRIQSALTKVLNTFKTVRMITFTLNPQLFTSPESALRYVRKRRCISECMRSLRKAGLLYSNRYFSVIEWHKRSDMAHFHVLVDAREINQAYIETRWNCFRPDGSIGDRFGTARITRRLRSILARYVVKNLVRNCNEVPTWLLDFEGQVPRFSPSRGFFAKRYSKTSAEPRIVPH